jgi:hypothetical protein
VLLVVPALPDRAREPSVPAEIGVDGGTGNAPRTDSRMPVGVVIDDRSGTRIGAGRLWRRGEPGAAMCAGDICDASVGVVEVTSAAVTSVTSDNEGGVSARAGASSAAMGAVTEFGVGVIERGSVSVSGINAALMRKTA